MPIYKGEIRLFLFFFRNLELFFEVLLYFYDSHCPFESLPALGTFPDGFYDLRCTPSVADKLRLEAAVAIRKLRATTPIDLCPAFDLNVNESIFGFRK